MVAGIDTPSILPRFSQVDVDLDVHGKSLHDCEFDTAHEFIDHEQLSAIWPLQPPASVSHLHVYMRPSSGVSE